MNDIKKYLAEIGARGGAKKGKTKKRGGSTYYQELSKKGVAARRKK